MPISYQEIKYAIKHPFTLLEFIFNKFKLTKRARILNNGERIIIKDFNLVKKSTNINSIIHIKRYEWAKHFLTNSYVLDNGCGTGYGTNFLANNKVKEIVGVDISKETISFAQKKYQRENLVFKQMNSLALDFLDKTFDAVVSFDVIEHIDEKFQEKFISEIYRVLKDGGILLIGNPNSLLTRLKNPHHKKELTLDEFESLLKVFFKDVKLYGENFILNGVNLRENWYKYKTKLKYHSLEISESDYKNSYNLLAKCIK
ncbi:MAG: class I SAM-dependent methyltransferase [Candidatus Hermodarchaeota archaeon]